MCALYIPSLWFQAYLIIFPHVTMTQQLFSAFEECYTFMLLQNENWRDQVASIEVLEVENGEELKAHSDELHLMSAAAAEVCGEEK